MRSFPKISLHSYEYTFGKTVYSIGLFNVLPQYTDEVILNKIMELAQRSNLPEFIYNNSAWMLYLSAKLEKDLIHQNNVNKVTQTQQTVRPKVGGRR